MKFFAERGSRHSTTQQSTDRGSNKGNEHRVPTTGRVQEEENIWVPKQQTSMVMHRLVQPPTERKTFRGDISPGRKSNLSPIKVE